MFRIWIGNLGKYNEGELVGEWVDMPCDDFDEVFERIGINEHYEETFIADFENDYGYDVSEWDDLEMLNEVAETLEGLNEDERGIFELLHDNGYGFDEATNIINNNDYIYYYYCSNMGDVAYEAYYECGRIREIEKVIDPSYIDWQAIGADMESSGEFYEFGEGYVEIIR